MFRTIGTAIILSSLAAAASAAQGTAMEAPATRDELADRIKSYQSARDCDGMMSLFYTKGVESDRKSVFEQTIRDNICANFSKKIASIAFQAMPAEKLKQPGAFENRPSVYTLEPSGSVLIDYADASPGETHALTFLYGSHDHKSYLVTTKNADAK